MDPAIPIPGDQQYVRVSGHTPQATTVEHFADDGVEDVGAANQAQVEVAALQPVDLGPGNIEATVGLFEGLYRLEEGLGQFTSVDLFRLGKVEQLQGPDHQRNPLTVWLSAQIPIAHDLQGISYFRIIGQGGIEDQ